MNIQFKALNYELAVDETALFEKKISSLEKFAGREEGEFFLYVTLGRNTEHHQSGNIWLAEGTAELNGSSFFAKAEKDSLRTAVDSMISQLAKEMRREKNKRSSLIRRGGARIKELFRRA